MDQQRQDDDGSHPTESDLFDHATGSGAGRSDALVRAHLESGCEACRDVAGFWRRVGPIAHEVATGADPHPPAACVGRAGLLTDGRRRRRARGPRPALAEVLADLVLDTFHAPALAGARASALAERQLLYSVRGFDIDVRLKSSPRGAGIALTGQILPDGGGFLGPDRVQAYLRGPGTDLASLPVSEFGEFSARDLPPGPQTLELLVDALVNYRLCFVL